MSLQKYFKCKLHNLFIFFEGVFGKGKCGCPCRDYYVPKCEIEYVEQCYYEHYEQVCKSVAVPVVREAKQIECQKCQKYKVPVPKTKWVKECNPIYDEKCKTEYHQHCKQETRCHYLYQTQCDNSGYQQHCESQPVQHCYPETKCHRTPETRCVPVQKEKCHKVPVETTQYVTEKQCLAFELNLDAISAQHGDPCAGYQTSTNAGYEAAPSHGHNSGHHTTVNQQYQQPTVNYGVAEAPLHVHNSGHLTPVNQQYQQPQQPAVNYGVADPVLQYQPVSNQYEIKRENYRQHSDIGNDNPFLRRPRTLKVSVKTLSNHRSDEEYEEDEGSNGWIPIPHPVYHQRR